MLSSNVIAATKQSYFGDDALVTVIHELADFAFARGCVVKAP